MRLLVTVATEYQIQISIPAYINSSEFFTITSLYSVRLKIGWMDKITWRYLQIQEKWAGRNSKLNFCVSIYCRSRMQECKDESEIYSYQKIWILHDK